MTGPQKFAPKPNAGYHKGRFQAIKRLPDAAKGVRFPDFKDGIAAVDPPLFDDSNVSLISRVERIFGAFTLLTTIHK
jgi:hypothetical protein